MLFKPTEESSLVPGRLGLAVIVALVSKGLGMCNKVPVVPLFEPDTRPIEALRAPTTCHIKIYPQVW